jgi:hypothetical protein
MLNEEMAKKILNAPQAQMQEKWGEQKDRMMRSMQEGMRYFINPADRELKSYPWGWEDEICHLGKHIFVKKGKKSEFVKADRGKVLFLLSGKLHVLYGEHEDVTQACEIVLNSSDGFRISHTMYYNFAALTDTYLIEFSINVESPNENIEVDE